MFRKNSFGTILCRKVRIFVFLNRIRIQHGSPVQDFKFLLRYHSVHTVHLFRWWRKDLTPFGTCCKANTCRERTTRIFNISLGWVSYTQFYWYNICEQLSDGLTASFLFSQFLNEVTKHSDVNKMSASNLAIVITPNVVSYSKFTSVLFAVLFQPDSIDSTVPYFGTQRNRI